MYEKLLKLLDNSHSPYSNVKVSAILKTKDGREFAGVNVENAAFPSGICAERSAIFSAISSGVKSSDIEELHLTSSLEHKLYPCGACRQVMAEFFNAETPIYVWNEEGSEEIKFEKLLQFSVTKGSFGWK